LTCVFHGRLTAIPWLTVQSDGPSSMSLMPEAQYLPKALFVYRWQVYFPNTRVRGMISYIHLIWYLKLRIKDQTRTYPDYFFVIDTKYKRNKRTWHCTVDPQFRQFRDLPKLVWRASPDRFSARGECRSIKPRRIDRHHLCVLPILYAPYRVWSTKYVNQHQENWPDHWGALMMIISSSPLSYPCSLYGVLCYTYMGYC
jgi:hypothetical protein